jgi:hypothetical protein
LEKGICVSRDGVNYRKVGKKIRYFFSTVIPWSLPVSCFFLKIKKTELCGYVCWLKYDEDHQGLVLAY